MANSGKQRHTTLSLCQKFLAGVWPRAEELKTTVS